MIFYAKTADLEPTNDMSEREGYTRVVPLEDWCVLFRKLERSIQAYAELKREVDEIERIDTDGLDDSLCALLRVQAG